MARRFVVQQHDATTLHFDLRLQTDGVLRSWAVPKGPSLDPAVRRRATGAVIVWDEGEIEGLRDDGDHLSFTLRGSKLAGRFGLTRTGGRQWVLVKVRDDEARPGTDVVMERPESVRSGRTW